MPLRQVVQVYPVLLVAPGEIPWTCRLHIGLSLDGGPQSRSSSVYDAHKIYNFNFFIFYSCVVQGNQAGESAKVVTFF